MDKARINFILDGLLFWVMMALAGTGFVRKYVLLSGSASRAIYGRKMEMTLLGITRDDWALVHFYLGWIIFALLALHIVLHWKQIVAIYSKWIQNSGKRLLVTCVFVVVSLILLLFPFFIKPVSL